MPLLTVIAIAFAAPREGTDYSLQSTDGRFIVADANAGKTLLRPAESAHGTVFNFVRVPHSDAVYLKFGDVLLTAFPGSAYGETEADLAHGCEFKLYTRSSDGKVALSSATGTLLRPGIVVSSDGSVALEQGGVPSDESAWWMLRRMTHDGSVTYDEQCDASPARLRTKPHTRAFRARRTALGAPPPRPSMVYLTCAVVMSATTAVMVPSGHLGAALLPVAAAADSALTIAQQWLLPPALQPLLSVGRSRVAAGLQSMQHFRHSLLNKNMMVAVLLHGLVTDGVSDALAQAIAVPASSRVHIDWRRVMRGASVAFVSDDLPFALWARFLWNGFEKLRPVLRRSPLPPWLSAILLSPLGFAALKTLVSQLGYESVSTAMYLSLQEVARGGGLQGAWRELRSKFWRAWMSGLMFFSSTHLLMFLAPVWWMQPILDNLSCLAFNTYLAVLSHESAHAPPSSSWLYKAEEVEAPEGKEHMESSDTRPMAMR